MLESVENHVKAGVTSKRFHSRDQQLCKFIGTKKSVYVKNSHRIGLVNHFGRRFIVLVHQYGHHNVIWERSIN